MAAQPHGLRKHLTHHSLLLIPALLLCIGGCRHVVDEEITPAVSPAPSYSMEASLPGKTAPFPWWHAFDDELLNTYIRQALAENFTLQEGYARLKQAQLSSRQADSRRYPTVRVGLGADQTWQADGEERSGDRAAMRLAWEVDLWGRLSAADRSAKFNELAREEELQGLAIFLSAEVAETYYQIIEQSLLLDLLKHQVSANATTLSLIKLRFANGVASLVDVYQQEELLASVKAQLPLSEARLIVLHNRLDILLGVPPDRSSLPIGNSLPRISPLPDTGVPADLLRDRPDLRQLQRELVGADYRVAEAVADRLPSISIGGSAGLVNGALLFSIFADALADVLDWGYKKNEVERRKAMVEEKLASFSQRYLLAIGEVENSLWQERKHQELLTALEEQLRIARATLTESRNRYVQGVSDYLPVLSALVSLQKLERSILQRQREHLSYRLLLYRALGGGRLTLEFHPHRRQS